MKPLITKIRVVRVMSPFQADGAASSSPPRGWRRELGVPARTVRWSGPGGLDRVVAVQRSTSASAITKKNTDCPLCTAMLIRELRYRRAGRASAKVSTRSVCGITQGS